MRARMGDGSVQWESLKERLQGVLELKVLYRVAICHARDERLPSKPQRASMGESLNVFREDSQL